MEIRKAVLEDASIWNKLVFTVKSENLPSLYKMTTPITLESTEEYLKKILKNEGSFVLLCIENDIAVGSLDLIRKEREEENHVGEFGICILSEYRGKGIGQQLIQKMEEVCRQENRIRKIEFEVISNNDVGMKLYKKMKYEIEGIKKRSIVKDDKEIDMIIMGKYL